MKLLQLITTTMLGVGLYYGLWLNIAGAQNLVVIYSWAVALPGSALIIVSEDFVRKHIVARGVLGSLMWGAIIVRNLAVAGVLGWFGFTATSVVWLIATAAATDALTRERTK